jgi:hypothetical protein
VLTKDEVSDLRSLLTSLEARTIDLHKAQLAKEAAQEKLNDWLWIQENGRISVQRGSSNQPAAEAEAFD